jgi:hypothetical protein
MFTDLVIYAGDSVAVGRLDLAHERMADLLRSDAPIGATDVHATALAGSRSVWLPSLALDRDEILVAVAHGPRGNPVRRIATLGVAAVATIGPYRVTGQLHAPRLMDPFELARRRRWIALTSATVAYLEDGRSVRCAHDTILLNARWVATLTRDGAAGPSLSGRRAWPAATAGACA